jgi:hypothetical protein
MRKKRCCIPGCKTESGNNASMRKFPPSKAKKNVWIKKLFKYDATEKGRRLIKIPLNKLCMCH